MASKTKQHKLVERLSHKSFLAAAEVKSVGGGGGMSEGMVE